MTVGSFKSDRDGRCECGNTWKPGDRIYFKPGERGYWCGECEKERQGQVSPPSPVETDAAKGHRENMESAKLMRDTLCLLIAAVSGLTTEDVNLRSQIQLLREGRK